MKAASLALSLATLAALSSAAPWTPDHNAPPFHITNSARQFSALVTFIAAGGVSFSQSFVADGSAHSITNPFAPNAPISISSIQSDGGATCGFQGLDGSSTVIVGDGTVDVGPPQALTVGSCLAL